LFTGIVEETGDVAAAEWRGELLRVRVRARRVLETLRPGGSIAVSGCCLTAVAVDRHGFSCELAPETLARTAFGKRLRPGAAVNLERPLPADGRLDGHIVQGHVDGVGTIREFRRRGASAELTVAAPRPLQRYLAAKGSIAVDGVSLTVAALHGGAFTVALIPYTLQGTTLGDARPGDAVNLEADVVAKYVERLLGAAPSRPRAARPRRSRAG
jgi:riboflavin synthase